MTVDRDAVVEPEEEEEEAEEETARRSVWEERCAGLVECGCLGDTIGLHRTDVVPAKRSTALRMKTAGRCMECSAVFRASEDSGRGAGVMT